MFNDTIRAQDMQLRSAQAPLKFDFTIHNNGLIGMLDMCTGFDGLDKEEYADKLKAALLAMIYLIDTIEGRLFELDEDNTRDIKSIKKLLLATKYSLVKQKNINNNVLSTILKTLLLEIEKMDVEIDSFNVDISSELSRLEKNHKPRSDMKPEKKEQLENVYNTVMGAYVEDEDMNNMVDNVNKDNVEPVLLNLFYRLKASEDKTHSLYKTLGKLYDSWDWTNNALKVQGARKAKHFARVRGEALSGDTLLGIMAFVAGDPRFGSIRLGILDSILDDHDKSL